ncbi:MAG: HAMP domain-containing protein [Epsilonproteobacteria bacterium]|nr:HAMP domain-containing protein [Campylobacterota bacterium]
MIFKKIKSIKSKIFLSYSMISIVGVLFFNAMLYYSAKTDYYEDTINALKSISRDVVVDDIENQNIQNGMKFASHKYKFSIDNVYIQARYKGKIVLKSTNMKNFEFPKYSFSQESSITKAKFKNKSKDDFIIYSSKVFKNEDYILQIATTTRAQNAELEEIIEKFLVGDPIVIFIILIILYKMLQDILKPMNTIIKTARDISITDLDKRIPYTDNGDEFAQLAKTFNKMLSRLQTSFNQVKRFSSDASHQLKTPLTSMRLQMDVALKTDRDNKEYKRVLKSVNNEIVHLQNMINNLFLLAQMDDEIIKQNFTQIDLDTTLMNEIEEFVLIANKKGVSLDIKEIEHTEINAENTLISILCSNLIDNAIKYTPSGKKISIGLKNSKLTIEDEGIGIEKKNLKIVFDRFFRVESNKLKGINGFGLGLPMVKIITDIHDATLNIKSQIGTGTKIEIQFFTSKTI